MKIVTIEPTPSPNSMKIVLDTELPSGTSYNYKKADAKQRHIQCQIILNVNGVRGIYHVMNFMAVERVGNVAWESILADIQAVINEESKENHQSAEENVDEHFGEVYVHVQTYKDIPLTSKSV